MRALAAAAAEQRDAPSFFEEISQLVERLIGGHDNRLRGHKSHRQRRGRVRRRLKRNVPGNDDDADTPLIDRTTYGDFERAGHLFDGRNEFAIAGAFPKKLLGMGFLEIARADLGRGNVSRDGHTRRPRAVAVEQAIDQVQVARTATSGADRETARDMRTRAGRERGDFLVPDMQPLNAAMAAQGIGEAIEAVAYDSIDTLDTGGGEGLDHLVCNSARHDILLTMGCMHLVAVVGAARRPR